MPMLARACDGSWRLEASRLGLPAIRECGWIVPRRAQPLLWHRNPGYEITVAVDGEFRWELADGTVLVLPGGQLAITQPATRHRGWQALMTPGRLLYLVIDPRRGGLPHVDAEILDRALAAGGDRAVPAGEAVLAETRAIAGLLQALSVRDDALAAAGLRLRLPLLACAAAAALQAPPPRRRRDPIDDALAWLDAHLDQTPACSALAARCGLSRSRFFERFRQRTGQTPTAWLLRRRCEQAAMRLRSGRATITAIALECGFCSSQYFARVFRRHIGCTPRQWRHA